MKKFLGLLFIFALAASPALATCFWQTTTFHAPVALSKSDTCPVHFGWTGYDIPDASGLAYSWGGELFLLEQHRFYVFDGDVLIQQTNDFTCSGVGGDHEGITLVNPWANHDVVIVQSENGGGGCVLDQDDIFDGGNVTPITNFDWPTNDADCGNGYPSQGGAEGVAFVSNSDDYSGCDYGGYLLANDQGGSPGYIYKYCMHGSTLDCIARYAKPSCNGSTEVADMKYDYNEHTLHIQSDNGNAVCQINLPTFPTLNQEFDNGAPATTLRVLRTIYDPTTGRNNTFEGFDFKTGEWPSKIIAYADDGTSGETTQRGLWLFADSFYLPPFWESE